MKLEIKSVDVVTKAGVGKRSGKPYEFRLQYGWLHGVDGYPQKVEFMLGDGQAPFTLGFYELGSQCFQVDRNQHPVIVLNRATPAK